jgi:hypothetical protein
MLQIKTIENPAIQKMYDDAMKDLCVFFELDWNKNTPKLYLVQDEKAIQELWNNNIGDSVAGWLDNLNIYTVDREYFKKGDGQKYSDEEYAKLIKHELAHVFTQVVTNTYDRPVKPDWLWEGLAMYLAGDIDLITPPKNLGNFLDFYEQDMSNTRVYEEAEFAVKTLVDKFGKEKLLDFMKKLEGNKSPQDVEKVFKEAYDMDLNYPNMNKF